MGKILARLFRRRACQACGHPSRPGDRLVRSGGYRIHRSHTTERWGGFYRTRSRR